MLEKMIYIYIHSLLVTRSQVSYPRPMSPLVLFHPHNLIDYRYNLIDTIYSYLLILILIIVYSLLYSNTMPNKFGRKTIKDTFLKMLLMDIPQPINRLALTLGRQYLEENMIINTKLHTELLFVLTSSNEVYLQSYFIDKNCTKIIDTFHAFPKINAVRASFVQANRDH